MRSGYRILLSIYVTFIIYSLLSLIWGSSGILETARLTVHRDLLAKNTERLSEINENLDVQFESLSTDSELITLKARELGYYADGEGEIVISGYKKRGIAYSVGSYYKNFEKRVVSGYNLRMVAAVIGLLCFLFMTLGKGSLNAPERKSSVTD